MGAGYSRIQGLPTGFVFVCLCHKNQLTLLSRDVPGKKNVLGSDLDECQVVRVVSVGSRSVHGPPGALVGLGGLV